MWQQKLSLMSNGTVCKYEISKEYKNKYKTVYQNAYLP
jgi:hypothetical protein